MNTTKLRRSSLLIAVAGFAVAVTGCNNTPSEKPSAASPSPAVSASPVASVSPAGSPAASPATGASKTDSLVGRWSGPEGTSLNVAKKGDKYSIDITNLDGTKTFEGTAKGDVIEFTRDGKTQTIKAASGAETGMKGFEKESNCVVINKGSEGFCKK